MFLHGRHFVDGPAWGHDGTSGLTTPHTAKAWMATQYGEVKTSAKTQHHIHRVQNNNRRPIWLSSIEDPSGTDQESPQRYSTPIKHWSGYSSLPSSSSRTMHKYVQGRSAGETAASKPLQATSNSNILGGHTTTGQAHHYRPHMVEQRTRIVEWEKYLHETCRNSAADRRISDWMGWFDRRQQHQSSRVLGPDHGDGTVKCSRTHGGDNDNTLPEGALTGQSRSGDDRQYYNRCLHHAHGRSKSWSIMHGDKSMVHLLQPEHRPHGALFGRERQPECRRTFSSASTTRMASASQYLSHPGWSVGQTHDRPFCQYAKPLDSHIQRQVLGPVLHRRGRSGTERLESTQQFLQCPVQFITSSDTEGLPKSVHGNRNCTMVAREAMVPATVSSVRGTTVARSQKNRCNLDGRGLPRATTKCPVAFICLENLWTKKLHTLGWDDEYINQYIQAWAPKTRVSYNSMLRKCAQFCQDKDLVYPPNSTKDLAAFLCHIADTSTAPRAQLVTASAALSLVYGAMNMDNVMHDSHIQHLISGVIKSRTLTPAKKSSVMPIAPFRKLFQSFGSNNSMSIERLRMKAVTSLALVLMLRPSDIAPRSVVVDPTSGEIMSRVFSTDQVTFQENSVTVTLQGIKNDTSRSGFTVRIPAASDEILDPVYALRSYILRTESIRRITPSQPVFITLQQPYRAVSADTISHILNDAIKLAGLSNHGFSAKCFRPTGATYAVELGYDPETVMRIGRWKTRSVFFDHYVHSQIPDNYTTAVLHHD